MLLLLLSGLALWPAGAGARTRCRVGHHAKVLLKTRAIVVFSRQTGFYGEESVFACSFHAGRVRTLGARYSLETSSAGLTLMAHAGDFIVDRNGSDSQYSSDEQIVWINVATGRTQVLWQQSSPLGSATTSTGVNLASAALTPDGRTLLGVYSPGDVVQLFTGHFRAALQILDSGTMATLPPASVSLSGRTAHWTHDGVARMAVL